MKRILIVDDIPGWVRFHKGCIEHLPIPNVQIDCAYCAKEALAKLETSIDNPYDVIFTDMQMEPDFLPKFAGEYYKNTQIVIVSAAPNIKAIAERYGVLYLPKTVARNSDAEVYREFVE